MFSKAGTISGGARYICTYMYVYEPVRYAIVPISCNGMLDRKNCGNKYIPKYVYVVANTFILCNYIRTKYKLCTVLRKKVSTKFAIVRKQFAIVHILFMNLYYVRTYRHKRI